MKKRCLLLVCVLAAVCALVLPAQVRAAEEVASGTCGDSLNWALDDAGTLTVSGSGDMAAYAELSERPWNAYLEQIQTLKIGQGVTGIADNAFASCANLTAIHFAGNAPAFGSDVFSGVTAKAYYPAGNDTWTEEVKLGYGGSITWEAHCDHQWQEATCAAPKTCTLCGETEGEPTEHSYEETVTEPTCTEQGYTTHTCSACGDSYQDTYTDPKGHAYEAVTVDPTCTEPGYTGQKCTVCGDVIVENYTAEPLGHSYEDVTVEMTCTQDGFVGQICSACGDTITQEHTEAPGHTVEVDIALAPTCTEDGLSEGKHCSVCNEVLVEQEVVPATGHPDANKDYICDVCRKDLCTKHNPKTIRGRAATCEKTGLTNGKKCSKCGDVLVAQEIIPALGHDWQAATCTAPETCAVCGVTQGDVLEHSFGQWEEVQAPTVEQTGLSQRVCEGCGYTEEKELAKLEPPATQPPTEPTQPVQTQPRPTQPAPILLPVDNRNPVLLIVAVACLAGSVVGFVVLLLGRKKE